MGLPLAVIRISSDLHSVVMCSVDGSFFIYVLMIKDINICCWNSRGAASRGFPRVCRDMCKHFSVDLFIILEPRCSGERAGKVITQMGFSNSWRWEAQGF